MAHSSALPAPMHYDQTHYPNLARSTHQNYTQISLSKNNLQSALSFHNSTMPNMFDDSYRGCLSEDTPQLVLYSHKIALLAWLFLLASIITAPVVLPTCSFLAS